MYWRRGLVALLACVSCATVDGQRRDPRARCSTYGPRVACGPVNATEVECGYLNCCWSPMVPTPSSRRVQLPSCYTGNAGDASYSLSRVQESGEAVDGQLDVIWSTQPELGPDISPLALRVAPLAPDVLRVKIGDPGGERWEVPAKLFGSRSELAGGGASDAKLSYSYTGSPFSLTVSRADEGLFSIEPSRFVFKDQYIEVNTAVPSDATLYGLGEHTPSAGLRVPRDGLPITLWNRDIPCALPDTNLYGSHPFVMLLRKDGSAFGVALVNSNAIEVSLTADGISWRAVGGILDFHILAGPSPADVLDQFTRLFGRPHMPPYWSLGFHQCKWGYKTVQEVGGVVDGYADAGIPLEVMWTDIDYMKGWRDFTNDPVAFPLDKFQALVEKLHTKGQRWVPIVDPGIMVNPEDAAYTDGLAKDVFLKDVTGQPYVGQVWPGAVHYPDYSHPAAQDWWFKHLSDWHKQLPFDGLWIDMNEVSNFCTGDVCEAPDVLSQETSGVLGDQAQFFADDPTVCFLKCRTVAEALNGSVAATDRRHSVDKPPYEVSNGNTRLPLGHNTAAMSASAHDGTLQYDAHNLYGLQQASISHPVMAAVTGARPFVLSRSTFLGSGAYTAHWTGDNAATWNDLRWSITAILNSGLFGIPFVGADICGFMGNTTEELCSRWISAGAFYPFTRDHSGAHTQYQELYRWPSVAEAGRRALNMRYQLLPYLYTQFHIAHRTGAPVARPLFWAAPGDAAAREAHAQWLLGDAVLVSPVVHEGADTVEAYFPAGIWHSLFDTSTVDARDGGAWAHLPAPLGHVPLHVRGGAVVPLQRGAMTTREVRASPLTLVVALQPQELPQQPEWQQQAKRWASHLLRLLHIRLPRHWPGIGTLQQLRASLRQRPPAAGAASAHGWMFHDEGDAVQVPDAADNFLSFSAVLEAPTAADGASRGAVTAHFGKPGAVAAGQLATRGACSGVPWPALQGVRFLGVHTQVDPTSVRLDVADPGSLPPAQAGREVSLSSAGTTLPAAQVSHDVETGVLEVSGLAQPIECPKALRIAWSTLPSPGPAAAADA